MSMEWLSHLFLHPREVVLFYFPMQIDGVKYEMHYVQEEKPLFGLMEQKIPVQERVPVPSRVWGLFAVTNERIFFLSKPSERVNVPEVLWEIYLHDLVEIEAKGLFSSELHIDFEHNEEIRQRIFYGPNAGKLEQRLLALIQTEKWLREHPRRTQGKLVQCHYCGKMVDWRDIYCPHCGKGLRRPSQPRR